METLCRRSRDALHWEGLLSAKVDNIMRSRKAGMKTQGRLSMSIWPLWWLVAARQGYWPPPSWMHSPWHRRKLKRIVLEITLCDRKHNTWIRQPTGVTNITDAINKSERQWAGHVARLRDNRWTFRTTDRLPREGIRPRGKPNVRWTDDLARHLGPAGQEWPETNAGGSNPGRGSSLA